jgi:hypothetical protein
MMIDQKELEFHVAAAVKEFARSKPNCAETFCVMVRRLARIPGCSETMALQVARSSFPGSYRAYSLLKKAGTAPPLFHREEFQKRLERAARTGRIN